MVKFRVTLTEEERGFLQKIVSSGKGAARRLLHARILLQADVSAAGLQYPDETIAEALEVSLSTIHRVRQRFVDESFEAALQPRAPRQRPDKVVMRGEVEQQLIALACGEPPRGYGRWTVRLLADHMVELGYVPRVSRETIRQALKKTTSSCGRSRPGAFHPERMLTLCITWKMSCASTNCPTTQRIRSCVWTKPVNN